MWVALMIFEIPFTSIYQLALILAYMMQKALKHLEATSQHFSKVCLGAWLSARPAPFPSKKALLPAAHIPNHLQSADFEPISGVQQKQKWSQDEPSFFKYLDTCNIFMIYIYIGIWLSYWPFYRLVWFKSKPQQYRETPRPFNVKHVNLSRTGGFLASNPSLAGRETNLAPGWRWSSDPMGILNSLGTPFVPRRFPEEIPWIN